jgi:hypothetical protein
MSQRRVRPPTGNPGTAARVHLWRIAPRYPTGEPSGGLGLGAARWSCANVIGVPWKNALDSRGAPPIPSTGIGELPATGGYAVGSDANPSTSRASAWGCSS